MMWIPWCPVSLYPCPCLLADNFLLCSVNPVGGRTEIGKTRVEKLPQPSGNHDQLSNSKKPEADGDAYNSRGPLAYEDKSRRGTNLPADIASADKVPAFRLQLNC